MASESDVFVTRVVELRSRRETHDIEELESIIAAFRSHGMPRNAEVNIQIGSIGGSEVVARYWPDEDENDDDNAEPVTSPGVPVGGGRSS